MAIKLTIITTEPTPRGVVGAALVELDRVLELQQIELKDTQSRVQALERGISETREALLTFKNWSRGQFGEFL